MFDGSRKIDRRVVIITRPTRLDNILAKENTLSQARFKLQSMNTVAQALFRSDERNTDFEMYENEHNIYQDAVQKVRERADRLAVVQVIPRKYLPNFMFSDSDIIVCIGQDGLVANTIKYLNSQPVIGVNPDKASYDGILLPFTPDEAVRIIQEVAAGKRKHRTVSMGEARLPDGQNLLAVNDFFIGQRGHVSSRYIIKYNGLKEPQSSSGVIISTGLGSTGWMKSIISGAQGISAMVIGSPYGTTQRNKTLLEDDEDYDELAEFVEYEAYPDIQDIRAAPASHRMVDTDAPVYGRAIQKKRQQKKELGVSELSKIVGKWESRELLFAVREPFASKTSGTGIVFGRIDDGDALRIESLMGENGVIFSDGIESDFLEFNSGMEVSIRLAKKTGQIVI